MRILIVEDDVEIANNLKVGLERKHYVVIIHSSIEDATQELMAEEYDLVICDRRLPDGDGLEIVKICRAEGIDIPILVLTARSKREDLVSGLDAGADDYLSKPFDQTVLLARVRALLRRREKRLTAPKVVIGKVVIDTNAREVKIGGKNVALSPKEYGVLEYLLVNRNRVVERLELMTHVWGDELDLFSNTVDVHVRYLRQKLGSGIIVTVRGKGYRLCTPN